MYMSHGDLSKRITVPFHIFGTVMGKRKLRFDQRKNYERKKRRMTVSPLTCVSGREGFSRAEKNRMLLSTETLLGIRMTGICKK